MSATPLSPNKHTHPFAHSVALITLFLLGNLIISFPKGQGQTGSLWGLLAAFLIGGVSAAVFSRTIRLPLPAVSVGEQVLCVGFLCLCLAAYYDCCGDYLHMVNQLRLPDTPLILIACLYLGLTVLFASARPDMAAVFSLVSVLFCLAAAVVMFFVSFKSFDRSLLDTFLTPEPRDIADQALIFFAHSAGQLLIPVLYLCYTGTALKRRPLKGLALAGGVLLLCLFQIILALGGGILVRIDFPYTTATGAITTNHSFTRTDIFTFYVYFVTALLKASLCTAVAVRSAKRVFGLSPWWIRIGFAGVTLLLLLIPATTHLSRSVLFSFFLLCLEALLSIGYLVCYAPRRSRLTPAVPDNDPL